MSYLESIDAAFRRQLIDNPNVSALVGARVYPTYLAAIKNPSYPCICFQRQPSPRDHRYNTRVMPIYEVWIYSTKNFGETDKIYEYMKNIFDNEWYDVPNVTNARVGFKILDHGSQDMDPNELLYSSNFRVQAYGFFA